VDTKGEAVSRRDDSCTHTSAWEELKMIPPTPITVWFSSKHAELYETFHTSSVRRSEGVDLTGPCHKNYAVIDGVKQVYTAISSKCREDEPYEGALKAFADYGFSRL
jgi:hypothetical protein